MADADAAPAAAAPAAEPEEAAPAAADEPAETVPRETLYLNNLNEKVPKEELKRMIYAAFTQFGPILDVVAVKTFKMRGQAFVVFRDIEASAQALRQMQGFPFYDKPMQLSYAKAKSDATSKLDGTFEGKVKAERAAKRKAEREAAKEAAKAPKAAPAAAGGAGPSGAAPAAPKAAAASGGGENLPNQILFVEKLPDQVNEMMLNMLFQQFPGFKEVRLVPGKAGIAFVEFGSDAQAGVAMAGLQGFKVTPTNLMKITYAKR